MKDYSSEIREYIDLEIAVLKKLDAEKISILMNALDSTRLKSGTIYIMGNGGSATTASHFVNDFNKGLSEYLEKPFRFVCLNDNTATVMAIANDIGYDEVFAFQLRGKVMKDDLVIGISGSGNSKNVLKAIEIAKSSGAMTVGLTGFDGGRLAKVVDISLNAPIMSMQVTEDIHMIFDHLMMAIFYKELCGKDHLIEL
ncbi:MAG: SIS domain-containing protein [Oscillospiraceae bacterium]|nr:SIS domain-containing protein [Oscillospiraceae bacterium]